MVQISEIIYWVFSSYGKLIVNWLFIKTYEHEIKILAKKKKKKKQEKKILTLALINFRFIVLHQCPLPLRLVASTVIITFQAMTRPLLWP